MPSEHSSSLEWKIELLYDIGALGVVLDRKTAKKLQSFRHAFSFNEGQLLTNKLGREDYSNFQFALHPTFCESLHLDTSKNQELVLPIDWDYLYENERLSSISSL